MMPNTDGNLSAFEEDDDHAGGSDGSENIIKQSFGLTYFDKSPQSI